MFLLLAAFISQPWYLAVEIKDGEKTVWATKTYANQEACSTALVWAATHAPVNGTVVDATCTPGPSAT